MARVLASFLRLSESHLQPYVVQAAPYVIRAAPVWNHACSVCVGWGGSHICCCSCCHLPDGETMLTMCTRMASKIAWWWWW